MAETRPAVESLVELLDERQHLLEIGLWIFDSATTADRIVQETYRRWYALDEDERAAVAVPRAWVTRAAGSICAELLASAAAIKALEAPSVIAPAARSDRAGLIRSMVMDRVSDLDTGLGDGRLRLRRSTQTMLRRHARVVHRFAAACETSDLAMLAEILAADVIVVSDGGGKVRTPLWPVEGAGDAALFVSGLLTCRPSVALAVEPVNGRMGLVLRREGQAMAVISLSVAGHEVTAVWVVANPDKLSSWHTH
jgi:RNA polymerase sigma-70 factor (ECF subfamily)